jgi:hypothetical protein
MRTLLLSVSLSLRQCVSARAAAPLARRGAPGAALPLGAPQPRGSLSYGAAASLLLVPRRGFAAALAAPAARAVEPASHVNYTPDQNARFAAQLALLRAYKDAHGGSTDVPKRYVSNDGHHLGDFVNKQRVLRSQGKLGAERVAALDALGFNWSPMDTVWNGHFEALRAYADAHNGSVALPKREGTLGRWLGESRSLWRRGLLAPERVAKLAALGVTKETLPSARPLSPRRADDAPAPAYAKERDATHWRAMLAALREYADAHGGATTVPCLYPPNTSLGFFVQRQRMLKKKGKLPAALVAELDAIRFVWDVNQAHWQQRIDELAAYAAAHGNVNVPKRHASVGAWLVEQRSAWRAGKLAPERVAALQALGVTKDSMHG